MQAAAPPEQHMRPCSSRRRLCKLAAPKVTPVVLAITYLGWLTSLSVVALVPIDVYSALTYKNTGPLVTLWSISYWCVVAWQSTVAARPHSLCSTASSEMVQQRHFKQWEVNLTVCCWRFSCC